MSTISNIHALYEGQSLDEKQAEDLFDAIFQGQVEPLQLASLLIAMKVRKEKPCEIVGAVRSMRKFADSLSIDAEIFDTCGTGGDNSHSFNISTATALILSALNIPIAKHGNRSVSSKSGSADFLEALGIPIHLKGKDASQYFDRHKFIFLFAPHYHSAMKYAVPARKALGVRTIFNYLGPLTNPSLPKKQMIGVFNARFLPVYSEVARHLNYERLLLYSSQDGLDEVSPFTPTNMIEICGDKVKEWMFSPKKYVSAVPAEALPRNLSPQKNAELFMETLQAGQPTPLACILALNAATGLSVMRGGDIAGHYRDALECICSGEVIKKVHSLKEAAQ